MAQESAPSSGFFAWYAEGFSDSLGDRLLLFDNHGETLELLRLRSDLSRGVAFEVALRDRIQELENFSDPNHAKVLRVERLSESGGALAVASVHAPGQRLSQVLAATTERRHAIQAELALALTRQLLAALARFHARHPDVAHGAITPSRLVLTSSGQLVVTEYAFASALRHVVLDREQFWRELRVAVPSRPQAPLFDQRGDVTQVAVVALSLLLNREPSPDEYLAGFEQLLGTGPEVVTRHGRQKLSPALVLWLRRALQLDSSEGFASARQGLAAFDEAVGALEQARMLPSDAMLEPAEPMADEKLETLWDDQAESAPIPAEAFDMLWPDDATDTQLQKHADVASPAALPVAPIVPPTPSRAQSLARRPLGVVTILLVITVATAGALFVMRDQESQTAQSVAGNMGTLQIHSDPTGAEVFVNGARRGTTPLNLSMAAGSYALELRNGQRHREMAVSLAPGAQVSHFVELTDARLSGRLEVRSDPAGARVVVDGQVQGRAPLLMEGLSAGPHAVRIESEHGAIDQMVTVEAGAIAALVVPLSGLKAAAGWVSFSSAEELQVFENGVFLGTTRLPRIPLRAGRHRIELVNDALAFRVTHVVDVRGDRVLPVQVVLPRGVLDVNAAPWAEVWIDGQHVGETPLGNLSLPIGRHEVVFKHPQLGERPRQATVTLGRPTRLSVDLRQ